MAVRKPVASGQCESFISFSKVASLVEGVYPSLIKELSDIIQSAFDKKKQKKRDQSVTLKQVTMVTVDAFHI